MPRTTKKIAKGTETKKTVFIIMPFGDWFDTYHDEIYIKAIGEAGFKSQRLDDENYPVVLVQDMYDMTKKASVVLADLTNNNPNVLYELGLAHALDKPVIIIRDSIENLPFDLRPFRVISYDKNVPDWGKKLSDRIVDALEEIEDNPGRSLPSRLLASKDDEDLALPSTLPSMGLPMGNRNSLRLELEHVLNSEKHTLTSQRKRISPPEALALINYYLRVDMPDKYIISKVSRLGAPPEWVSQRIKENKRKK